MTAPAEPEQQEMFFLISKWELESMFTNSDNYELLERIRSRQHPLPPKMASDDKIWADFEQWFISTPSPQDIKKIVAKILKKTCAIRESISTDTPAQQRIADAIKELEKLDAHLESMWNEGRPTNSGAYPTKDASIAASIQRKVTPIIALLREIQP